MTVQISALVNLVEQATRQAGLTREEWLARIGQFRTNRVPVSERVHHLSWLIERIGGDLYSLFNTQGHAVYAVGRTPEAAADYVRKYRDFTAVRWSTERVRSCNGKRDSKYIFEQASLLRTDPEELVRLPDADRCMVVAGIRTAISAGALDDDEPQPKRKAKAKPEPEKFDDPSAERDALAMDCRAIRANRPKLNPMRGWIIDVYTHAQQDEPLHPLQRVTPV